MNVERSGCETEGEDQRAYVIASLKAKIREDLLSKLSCAKPKSLEKGEPRDGWEHWISVLGARSSF